MSPWPQRAAAAPVPSFCFCFCFSFQFRSRPLAACQIISENCLWRRVCRRGPSRRLHCFTSTAMSCHVTNQCAPMPAAPALRLASPLASDSLRPDEPYEMQPDTLLTHKHVKRMWMSVNVWQWVNIRLYACLRVVTVTFQLTFVDTSCYYCCCCCCCCSCFKCLSAFLQFI